MKTHKMLIVSTGGTIAGEVATHRTNADYEIRSAEHFAETIISVITDYKCRFDIKIAPTPLSLYEVDSSDIKPEHWCGIADCIYNNYEKYDSFVITHGTNTLAYTSAALSFVFPNIGKPVVLTGSQVPFGLTGSDALLNLQNAARVAALPESYGCVIRGILVVFGSQIITGTRVKKQTEFDYDAFNSFQTANIGNIGRTIEINRDQLDRHLKYQTWMDWTKAIDKSTLRYLPKFNANIYSVTEIPGTDPHHLLNLAQNKVDGFIVRAFGAGDLSISFRDVLDQLAQMKIPVVVTTQIPRGNASMRVNENGQYILKYGLAIPAYDMSIESQSVKLMWLLAQMKSGIINFEQLKSLMITDMCGEINVFNE